MSVKGKELRDLNDFEISLGYKPEIGICEVCDWRYLLPKGSIPKGGLQTCPHCFEGRLVSIVEEVEELPPMRPPEAQIPSSVGRGTLEVQIERFSKGIPFSPSDLKTNRLIERLTRIYLPVWWVDCEVRARWEFEAGFDYEVLSHQDRYDQNRGGWISREITERRIRWEPRKGTLNRKYQNIATTALEEQIRIKDWLVADSHNLAETQPPEDIQDVIIRMPDRTPEDAWGEAVPKIRAAAAQECQEAVQAGHHRNFQWEPEYLSQNWTMLLFPVYTSYYFDDKGEFQVIYVNGWSGEIRGERRASMVTARSYSLTVLGIGGVIFLLSLLLSSLGLAIPGLLLLGIVGMAISLFIGLGALLPLALAWNYNRTRK